jgi:hypothetical protein
MIGAFGVLGPRCHFTAFGTVGGRMPAGEYAALGRLDTGFRVFTGPSERS